MAGDDVVRYLDRASGEIRVEPVLGDAFIRWAYGTFGGRLVSPFVFGSSLLTRLLAGFFNSPLSRSRIAGTIRDLGIDMSECTRRADEFTTFNDFFTRHLKPECRPFDSSPEALCCPADGRLLVYPAIRGDSAIAVKGIGASLRRLFGRPMEAFHGGDVVVVRLCPADYHRYHFPTDGRVLERWSISGAYHSVNPVAIDTVPTAFCLNRRVSTLLETPDFGEVAYLEVGACGVSGIHDTYPSPGFRKMDEKGYFDFGASTLVLVFSPDRVRFDEDLVEWSGKGIETRVLVGETIGRVPPHS